MTPYSIRFKDACRSARGAVVLFAAVLVCAIGLGGCTDGMPHGVTGTNGAGPGAPTNTSGVVSFSYSSFNAFGDGTYTVNVERTDKGAKISYDAFGYQELEGVSLVADALLLDELDAVYRDQHIAAWNGFDKVDNDVLDGGGFGLRITFGDGSELTAHGSNAYPEGIGAFRESIESILKPYREKIFEKARKRVIKRGTKGDLDSIGVHFVQHGTSGSDEYSFFILREGVRDNNFDVTIKSSGEIFPAGKRQYYASLPDKAIWFNRVQKLIERYGVMQWHRWDKTAEDYSNAEWFQLDFSYSEEGFIDAMGTEHPKGYDEFRHEFLRLMKEMIEAAEADYGLQPYEK